MTRLVAKSRTFDFHGGPASSHNNEGSFYENEDLAQADLDRCVVAFFADEFPGLDEVVAQFEAGIRVTKIACLLKVKPDLTVKVRLTVDMLRSDVHGRLTLGERVVLPRISESASSAVDLLVAWRNQLVQLTWQTVRPSRTMVKASNSQPSTLRTPS